MTETWDDERVARWLAQADALERQLAPVSTVLFDAAQLQPGERVLDVGCGAGPTTRAALDLVGGSGRVTGLDLSADMIAAARSAVPGADWIVADAVTWDPPPPSWDVVLSRFGVMFFTEPDAAFERLAAATVPGGRLAMATWALRPASPLFEVPLRATLAVADVEPPPPDGGPFSLHDPGMVADLLIATGWSDPATDVVDLELLFGGGMEPEAAARAALDFGPTRLVAAQLPPDVRDDAVASVEAALRDHVDDRGRVVLRGQVLVTTARRA